MAVSRPSLTEEDFSCSVCCDIFRDPVLLACSHSICKSCLHTFWEQRGALECPICRTVSQNPDPPLNIVLKNMCEAILEERSFRGSTESQGLCSVHGEDLTLFCTEDRKPVCVKCRDPKLHNHHSFRPVEEAAVDLKRELKMKLKPLQEKLRVYEEFEQTCDNTMEHAKIQVQNTEKQIKEEFEKLHQFLRDEEAARVAVLREEEEEKTQIMKKKIEEIRSEISSLADIIKSIEERTEAEDLSFLLSYKAIVERTQYPLRDPEMVSGSLINVAKHLGNLKFRVWEKMEEITEYTPVILDPNTAHPDLYLCESLSSVKFGEEGQQLPGNPERFDDYSSVLGSEGFDSGSHCWDIEVGDNTAWAVGVITESVYKHRENLSKFGLWYVGFYNGKYGKGYSPEILTLLRVNHRIQRIRVQLDWEKGKVVFTDSGHNTCLHIFKHNFTERVFPYFYNHCKLHPLKILPVKPSISVELHS
ncbi:nuclear factor 7, brain-like [Chanos chanos]|uniref:Nuclear factor 7, brain-like n=1 Tax=Chanos chanos TaxID=29144 RepID=A0A6J2WPH4_CHACN|nr:nuclear factor 7, brain-like [Chanos chanos]